MAKPERAGVPYKYIQAAHIDQQLFGREHHVRKQELAWTSEALDLCLMVEGENSRETCAHIVKQWVRMQRTHATFGYHDLEKLKYLTPAPGKPDLRTERIQRNTYLGKEAHTAKLTSELAAEREDSSKIER